MKNKSIILIIVAIICITVVYRFVVVSKYYMFNGGEVELNEISASLLSKDFMELGISDGSIYECNSNGLIKKDVKQNNLWSKSFNIETPMLKTAGNYVAVADISGRKVYVFDEKGLIFELNESQPIIFIEINKNGYIAVVEEKGNQNIIRYYNNKGEIIIERGTRFIQDGYPVDVAIGTDDSKMVTGYINVSNARLQTKLSFFGFEDKYDKLKEKIIGGFTYEDALLADIKYLDDKISVVIMDNKIEVFECVDQPEIIANIELNTKIKDIACTRKEIIVSYGEAINEKGKDFIDTVVVYNLKGKIIMKQKFDKAVKLISSSDKSYYIITEDKVLKFEGNKRLWVANTYFNIKDFYEINDNMYVAISDLKYVVYNITKK